MMPLWISDCDRFELKPLGSGGWRGCTPRFKDESVDGEIGEWCRWLSSKGHSSPSNEWTATSRRAGLGSS